MFDLAISLQLLLALQSPCGPPRTGAARVKADTALFRHQTETLLIQQHGDTTWSIKLSPPDTIRVIDRGTWVSVYMRRVGGGMKQDEFCVDGQVARLAGSDAGGRSMPVSMLRSLRESVEFARRAAQLRPP